MDIHSVVRIAEHQALSAIELNGATLDLGGYKNALYQRCFRGSAKFTNVNMDRTGSPDIIADLEQPLRMVADASYDNVLLINVLEHVFNYRELLREAYRVVRPRGKFVVVVPFLVPVHPSPADYRRFTGDALKKELELCGFHDVSVMPLGTGVMSARLFLIDRLLPAPIRVFNFYCTRHVAAISDAFLGIAAKLCKKRYTPTEYPLAYCVTAIR